MKTALLVGATGLIGREVLQLLQEDAYYEKVIVLSRKPIEGVSKCEICVVDFDKLKEQFGNRVIDDVFCCLGTTIRVAKSKEAFKKVDYEYPVELATLAKQNGASQYLLVSALGADKKSAVFYNRVKGEVEEAITALGYPSVHIFRPSLLLGERKEVRSGEDAAKLFFKLFGFLVPMKYRGIDSKKVAKAMLYFAKQKSTGTVIHESGELQNIETE